MTNLQIVGLVYLLLTLLYLRYLWRLIARKNRLRTRGIRTKGRVVQLIRLPQDEGPDMYTPVVQFHSKQGVKRVLKMDAVFDERKHPVRSEVAIVYDPLDPTNANAADDRGWGITIHMVICGGMIAFGVYTYLCVESERARLRVEQSKVVELNRFAVEGRWVI